MRIIYMGTPKFAVPCLQVLIDMGQEIVGVFTQPDRPKGRGQKLAFSPVKELAVANGFAVYQPEKLRNPEYVESIRKIEPDLIVVVAYGQILPESILQIPKHGCINVHASLLPKYRGAAPIQWSIINGEEETGITTMFMDKGLDTGDMILQRKLKILPEDNASSLHDKLSVLGAELLKDTVSQLQNGILPRIPQNHAEHTYARQLAKSDGLIDWVNTSSEITNKVRGMDPWPGAYTFIGTQMLKVWKVQPSNDKGNQSGDPGTIVKSGPKEGLFVQTGDGIIELVEIQAHGGKRLKAKEYLLGKQIAIGTQLGKGE